MAAKMAGSTKADRDIGIDKNHASARKKKLLLPLGIIRLGEVGT